jgi:DNA-binding response OmpR family regulator
MFYSAAAYERDIHEALRSGAQSYLVKPVRFDDLERVAALLTSSERGRRSDACGRRLPPYGKNWLSDMRKMPGG